MAEPVIEVRPNGDLNCFWKGRIWKRKWRGHHNPIWCSVESLEDGESIYVPVRRGTARELELLRKKGRFKRRIQRFPRTTSPGRIKKFSDIPRISTLQALPREWLIEGVVPQASLTLLTAPPAGFKTWFALSLAGAVSKGADFLERKTIRAPVLYVDYENPESLIHERRDVLKLDGEIRLWGHWLHDPPPQIGDKRLLKIARRVRPLIILDSFVRAHSADENNANQMASVIAELRRLADAGATVILLHHKAKSPKSQYRGSTDILAGVDIAFELRKKGPNNRHMVLECFKHRLAEEFSLPMRFDIGRGCFVAAGPPSSGSSSLVRAIEGVIREFPGISQKDLLRRAGLAETSGRDALREGEGPHWRSVRGKGKALHYFPPDDESE